PGARSAATAAPPPTARKLASPRRHTPMRPPPATARAPDAALQSSAAGWDAPGGSSFVRRPHGRVADGGIPQAPHHPPHREGIEEPRDAAVEHAEAVLRRARGPGAV